MIRALILGYRCIELDLHTDKTGKTIKVSHSASKDKKEKDEESNRNSSLDMTNGFDFRIVMHLIAKFAFV